MRSEMVRTQAALAKDHNPRFDGRTNVTPLFSYFAPDLCPFLSVMKEDVFSLHLAKVTPFIVHFWTLGSGSATEVAIAHFFYPDVSRLSLTV